MMSAQTIRLGAFASAFAIAVAPIQAGGQTVGVNSAVRNVVNVREDAKADQRRARVRERVRVGNQISTGRSSSLQVTLVDRSTFTMGPSARMTVDRFVYDPKRGTSFSSSVARGTFRFLSGSGKRGTNTVNTPTATIGIRGTILEGAVGTQAIAMAQLQSLAEAAGADPETATFIVLRGPGASAPAGVTRGVIDVTVGGTTITLNEPGQALFIPAAGMQPIRVNLATPSFGAFDLFLRTSPTNFSTMAAMIPQGSEQAAADEILVEWANAGTSQPADVGAPSSGQASGGSSNVFMSLLPALGTLVATILVASDGSSDERPVSA